MTIVVTRYDFRKEIGKHMKLAETEAVIICKSKMGGYGDGVVLISYMAYQKLKENNHAR